MLQSLESFQRYLDNRSFSTAWGIRATDLGYTEIPPGLPYPPVEHPESYTLNQEKGRVLEEYQVIYITHGKGVFWSEKSGETRIGKGTIFLLYPGVRHRYRPDPETGWNEYWIGFTGSNADSVVAAHFPQHQPCFTIGMHPDIQLLFNESCELVRHAPYGFRERVGLKILEILIQLHLRIHRDVLPEAGYEPHIRKACHQMAEAIQAPFDTKVFAQTNGLSHTSFRRHFKAQTGMAPIQYLLDLRIRKAKSLLTQTTLPVQTIAQNCGFENPLYFSRMFNKRTGSSPSQARKQSGTTTRS